MSVATRIMLRVGSVEFTPAAGAVPEGPWVGLRTQRIRGAVVVVSALAAPDLPFLRHRCGRRHGLRRPRRRARRMHLGCLADRRSAKTSQWLVLVVSGLS